MSETGLLTPRRLKALVGREIGLSDWFLVTQDRIDAFAAATEDRQWIHVDRERAAAGPLRGTVAHGFLLVSLLPHLLDSLPLFRVKAKRLVNYGLDRVRFIRPVRPGDHIRARAVLREIRRKGFRRLLLKIETTLEAEDGGRPAAVVDLLVLALF
jgi:acyl dehydratase